MDLAIGQEYEIDNSTSNYGHTNGVLEHITEETRAWMSDRKCKFSVDVKHLIYQKFEIKIGLSYRVGYSHPIHGGKYGKIVAIAKYVFPNVACLEEIDTGECFIVPINFIVGTKVSKKEDHMKKKYIVIRLSNDRLRLYDITGQIGGDKLHNKKEDAEKEALRLAEQERETFIVMESVVGFQPNLNPTTRIFFEN